MEIQLTEEQARAVYAPVANNLVSAAAGSGKTKVLSERIVERLKSGDTSIDRLLIVTFTRAAAMQMRERIAKALEKEYKKNKSEKLKRQLSLIAGADICTIDSFCIDLVKRNFFRVGVAPDFNIADDNAMAILREEVIIDVLEEMYSKGDENFFKLAESVGRGKNDNALKEMILKVYDFSRAFENPNKWLDEALLSHKAESAENERLFDTIAKEIEEQLKDLREILYSAKREAEYAGIDSYTSVFEVECLSFDKYLNKPVSEIGDGFNNFEFGTFSRKKTDESAVLDKAYLQSLHNEAKDFFGKIKGLFEIYTSPRGISYPKIAALIECVKLFEEKYMAEKLMRKELEFSDCEYLALKALNASEEAVNELRDKYDEIYIDEYQDTNPLQDALFTLISREARGEANLFIVGDIKQSIYRFRHSDPMLFVQKGKRFEEDEKGCKMLLTRNFRSRGEVLDSVNCIFERIMREGTAQVEYDDEHRLKCGAKYIEYNQNKSELYILDSDTEADDEELVELAKEQREALVAAKRIREMIDEGFMVSDGERMRRLKYSDIAVLSPALKNKADMIASVFSAMDIPMRCTEVKNFFDNLEIRTAVALLKAVDNPLCDIPLASVMRSPIFSFTENELMAIRLNGRSVPFYENVKSEAEKEGELAKKCQRLIDTLSLWRDEAYVSSTEKFVTRVIDESGYYSFVGALPGGGVRQENLRKFLSIAASYEKTQYKGLYNFVRYIDKTIETGGNAEGEADTTDEAVLVTTIHKSKGLEFPVVFVIGCGNKFNDKDASSAMIINPVGGIGLVEREADRRIKYKTAEYHAVSMLIIRESHAERMRLLYVAMTRAKEKLILIGTAGNYKKQSAQWDMYSSGKKMSDYKVRSINNYLDYVAGSIDNRYWTVTRVDKLPEIIEAVEAEEKDDKEKKRIEEVIYRLSYLYPFDGVKNIPSKMSVSEIKKKSYESEDSVSFFDEEAVKRVPAFLKEDEKLTGATRGTAFHRVMELIDLNEADVKNAIEGFVEKGFMTRMQADSIDVDKIEKFLKSPIAERMRKARRVWKEASFTIALDAKDVFENGEGEKICVQGTIDCLFEDEDGKIVLLDYKTDYYTDPEEIGKRYKKQLELYEIAVFNKFLQNCDEKCLYLFHKGDIINV